MLVLNLRDGQEAIAGAKTTIASGVSKGALIRAALAEGVE
jgi:hypothetical protein